MNMIAKFELNVMGRDFVVGDIHGCFNLLEKALEKVGFSLKRDRLFSVGDLIDRGPESLRALEFLAQPWFHTVCGNHDRFVVETRAGNHDAALLWLMNGGSWWLDVPAEIQVRFREVFAELPYAIETDTAQGAVGIVHADVPPEMTWPQFLTALEAGDHNAMETATWGRARASGSVSSGVKGISQVFCGHTVQEKGIHRLKNVVFIDTGAVYGLLNNIPDLGLTLVDLMTMEASTIFSARY